MRLRNEAKVGFIVTGGLVILLGVYWFLGGLGLRASTYPIYAVFPNALKLDKGAVARMAGVQVGFVESTALTRHNRARVNLRIFNDVRIPTDSVATITTGGFVGEYFVELVPGTRDVALAAGGRIRAESPTNTEVLMKQVSVLLDELQSTVGGLNHFLGDKAMQGSVRQAVTALGRAAESTAALTESARQTFASASPMVQQALANVQAATENAVAASRQMQDMLASDVRPNVKALMSQANSVAKNLDTAISQAQAIIQSLQSTAGTVNTTLAKFNTMADEAQATVGNLKDTTGALKTFATDPKTAADLRQTLDNAATTSAQLKELVTSLNSRFGKKTPTTPPVQRSSVPDYGLRANALWNTNKGEYRLDAAYTLPWADGQFWRLGFYDLGEHTQAIVQGGNELGSSRAIRYGIYASRLGVGVDQRLARNLTLSADVFRPNDPEAEVRAVLSLTKPLGLYAGVGDLFDPERRDLLVGVRYKR